MRRREAEDRRIQLLQAAMATLAETGIGDFTLAEVARRADVSAALIVHYFGDRDSLLEATFRLLVERVTTLPMRALAMARGPEQRLRAFVQAHLDPAELTSEASRAWLSLWGMALYVPALARLQRLLSRRMAAHFRRRAVDAQQLIGQLEARAIREADLHQA